MLELISAILFSISANIDNIPIGISYGIKKIHISFFKNMLIAIVTAIVTFTCMFLGQNLLKIFDANITNIIGASALIAIGLYTLIAGYLAKKRKSKEEVIEKRGTNNKISNKELIVVMLTLSINNIAAGIAASVTGVDIICTTICTFIFGFLFIFIGNKIGKKISSNTIERYSNIISSLILILLGIIELIF